MVIRICVNLASFASGNEYKVHSWRFSLGDDELIALNGDSRGFFSRRLNFLQRMQRKIFFHFCVKNVC